MQDGVATAIVVCVAVPWTIELTMQDEPEQESHEEPDEPGSTCEHQAAMASG